MSSSLIQVFKSATNGAADGTGVVILVKQAKALLGNSLPDWIVDYTLGIQPSLLGDYPTTKDVAPSAVFLVVFLIFALAHLYIFTRNFTRGHYFWLSLGFSFYNFIRFLGFTLRIVWAKDILKLNAGMASEVFLIIPIVILAGLNLILAQRIFTLYHPHLGSTKFFWFNMFLTYAVVLGVVVMAVVGQCIPYLYFLSEARFDMCKRVVRAAAILCVLFVSLAAVLVSAAFLIPPSKRDASVWVFQPYWVKSFSMFYFVEKNACQRAEESFKNRDANAFSAHRLIASSYQPGSGPTLRTSRSDSNGSQMKRLNSIEHCEGDHLTHDHSILIIALTTLILLISSLFRCVSCFINDQKANQSWIYKPVVMYIMFGLLESLVNILYLTGRVDLRFYRPDRLKKHHKGSVSNVDEKEGANSFGRDAEKTQPMQQDHNSSEMTV